MYPKTWVSFLQGHPVYDDLERGFVYILQGVPPDT